MLDAEEERATGEKGRQWLGPGQATGGVISFHAKRTWIIQPWMCPGIIFHGRKQTVTVAVSVLLHIPFPPSLTLLLVSSLFLFTTLSLSLSLTHSLFISLALYLGLVINYTDKLGPPAGFSSILYELVPFYPVSFCPAPRHFWFMRAHLRSLSTTGELTSSVSVVCERRL